MDERWRPVVGYESYYEISDLGRIKSLGRMVRKGRGEAWMEPHILRGTPGLEGRRAVMLCVRGKKTQRVVAPLVLEAFVGPRPTGTECCHWDGDPTNDTLGNLRWGTSKENSADQMRHGRHGMAIRTQCPRGHDLFPPNLASNPRGVRQCRACACAYTWARGRGIPRTDPRWVREADRQYSRIMAAGPRGPKKDNVKKTACPRGHQLSAPNLVNQHGRACLACGRTHSWARPRGIPYADPRWVAEADRRYAEIVSQAAPIGNRAKTACPRGHLLQDPNLRGGEGRACLACSYTHGWAQRRNISRSDRRWIAEADRRYAEVMAGTIYAVTHTA